MITCITPLHTYTQTNIRTAAQAGLSYISCHLPFFFVISTPQKSTAIIPPTYKNKNHTHTLINIRTQAEANKYNNNNYNNYRNMII